MARTRLFTILVVLAALAASATSAEAANVAGTKVEQYASAFVDPDLCCGQTVRVTLEPVGGRSDNRLYKWSVSGTTDMMCWPTWGNASYSATGYTELGGRSDGAAPGGSSIAPDSSSFTIDAAGTASTSLCGSRPIVVTGTARSTGPLTQSSTFCGPNPYNTQVETQRTSHVTTGGGTSSFWVAFPTLEGGSMTYGNYSSSGDTADTTIRTLVSNCP